LSSPALLLSVSILSRSKRSVGASFVAGAAAAFVSIFWEGPACASALCVVEFVDALGGPLRAGGFEADAFDFSCNRNQTFVSRKTRQISTENLLTEEETLLIKSNALPKKDTFRRKLQRS
jgi:hypothetical protein